MDWYREIGGVYANTQRFGRKVFIPADLSYIEEQRSKFNNIDMYATLYSYNSKPQSESHMIGPLYLDFDSTEYGKAQKDALTVLANLGREFGIKEHEVQIYFSGSKGFHLIIDPRILGIMPKKLLNEDYKKIAKHFYMNHECDSVDIKIYDTVRLFRIVNSINSKSGLYKIQITRQELEQLTYEQMAELAKEPREEFSPSQFKINLQAHRMYKHIISFKEEVVRTHSTQPIKTNTEKLLPCVLSMLEEGAQKGQRNNTVIIMASALFQAKESLDEVMEVIMEWNDNYNDEPLSRGEIMATIHSAHRQIQSGRAYGCKTIREMGLCVKDCPINVKGRR